MPETIQDAFWFLVGWLWAISDALENEMITEQHATILREHGQHLADEAKSRL